ncbi:hypothetical protein [Pseudomonas gingeri]|uniref:Uncharacterized protein n=1 Tax=Pseudomonas gingeri TaxID=117681 RepID=A0A7Y7YDQ0_9PSED|nr:hypothetical protein [Pseudomonas gingeri]NWB25812.1 hypothetical protein [Pseudomonas gingeri]NWC34586.1 hypothetical protein [Pseudomonas gingeri]
MQPNPFALPPKKPTTPSPVPSSNTDIATSMFKQVEEEKKEKIAKNKREHSLIAEPFEIKTKSEEELEHTDKKKKYMVGESVSQEKIYEMLDAKGYLFFSRAMTFVKHNKELRGKNISTSVVEEPGFLNCLAKTKNFGFSHYAIGLNDVRSSKGSFAGTFPDYYVSKNQQQIFAIELKTPQSQMIDFLDLLDKPIQMQDQLETNVERTIRTEIDNRKKHLPQGVLQILMFDICNLTGLKEDPIVQFYGVASSEKNKIWFAESFHSFMFCDSDAKSEILHLKFSEIAQAVNDKKNMPKLSNGWIDFAKLESNKKWFTPSTTIQTSNDAEFVTPTTSTNNK